MRTLLAAITGMIVTVCLAGTTVGETARTRCGCGLVLVCAGIFVGAAMATEGD
jgi:hypothetical protein